MLLPPGYCDIKSYFCDVLAFLNEYQWLYNVPVTKILIHDTLNKIPPDWAQALLALDCVELNEFPNGLIKDCWPQSLQNFCQGCRNLQLPVRIFQGAHIAFNDLPKSLCLGLTPKKKHEICCLGALIHEECQQKGIFNILDIGSGLGYLGQVLHHQYGYHVLGLESEPQLVKKAALRQRSLCNSEGTVSYLKCNISSESDNVIQQMLESQLLANKNTLNCHCQSEKEVNLKASNSKCLTNQSMNSSSINLERNTSPNANKELLVDTTELRRVCISENNLVTDGLNNIKPENFIRLKSVENADCTPRTHVTEGQFCMVGLHTCGDLSVSASELFLKLPTVHLFIVIPCCYHKMTLAPILHDDLLTSTVNTDPPVKADSSECVGDINKEIIRESFGHFPKSHTLKTCMEDFPVNFKSFLRRPFLRLASQETCVRWQHYSKEDHEEHSIQLIARAVLYLFAHQENLIVKKERRRGVRKTKCCTISDILDDMLLRYRFFKDSVPVIVEKSELEKLWQQYGNLCQLAEVFTGLQMAFQAMAESFVLTDKMTYLQENEEHNILSYGVVKVMDDKISPRCHALIARK